MARTFSIDQSRRPWMRLTGQMSLPLKTRGSKETKKPTAESNYMHKVRRKSVSKSWNPNGSPVSSLVEVVLLFTHNSSEPNLRSTLRTQRIFLRRSISCWRFSNALTFTKKTSIACS